MTVGRANQQAQRRPSKVDAIVAAAESGDVEAQIKLAHCYQLGKGVEQNKREALRWFTAAANKGHAPAQYCLALCLEQGDAGARDIQQTESALVWYERAAKQGHMKAQNNLAVCYEEAGKFKEAVHWYRCAAEQGHVRSQHNLALCYDDAKGVGRDAACAAHWYHEAALQGYAKAQAALAHCFESGLGVSAERGAAERWYKAAALQGHQGARLWLEQNGARQRSSTSPDAERTALPCDASTRNQQTIPQHDSATSHQPSLIEGVFTDFPGHRSGLSGDMAVTSEWFVDDKMGNGDGWL